MAEKGTAYRTTLMSEQVEKPPSKVDSDRAAEVVAMGSADICQMMERFLDGHQHTANGKDLRAFFAAVRERLVQLEGAVSATSASNNNVVASGERPVERNIPPARRETPAGADTMWVESGADKRIFDTDPLSGQQVTLEMWRADRLKELVPLMSRFSTLSSAGHARTFDSLCTVLKKRGKSNQEVLASSMYIVALRIAQNTFDSQQDLPRYTPETLRETVEQVLESANQQEKAA
jgi:hypothetical protein